MSVAPALPPKPAGMCGDELNWGALWYQLHTEDDPWQPWNRAYRAATTACWPDGVGKICFCARGGSRYVKLDWGKCGVWCIPLHDVQCMWLGDPTRRDGDLCDC